MNGPTITNPEPDESHCLPRLPDDAEQLIASSWGAPFSERTGRLGGLLERLGARGLPVLSLVASVTALLMAATAVGLTLQASPADGGSPEAAPRQEEVEAGSPRPVLLGRDGSDVINCVSDTVTLFLAGDTAPGGAIAAWLEKPGASLLVVMESVVGGYRAQLEVSHGAARVKGAAGSEKLLIRPGERVLFRLDGLLGARVIKVEGETAPVGRREVDTCGQRAQTLPW